MSFRTFRSFLEAVSMQSQDAKEPSHVLCLTIVTCRATYIKAQQQMVAILARILKHQVCYGPPYSEHLANGLAQQT